MASANIVIQVLGSKKSLNDIQQFTQGSAQQLADLAGKYALFAAGAAGVLASIKPAYDLLIASNGQLNATILQSQTAIASNFNVFDRFGNEITDIGDKIASQEGTIRDAITRLEQETQELVGITSATTTEAFNIVLAEGGKFLGSQLGDYEDTIDASIGLTKGLLAALGTLQIPIEQARQEFRALIQGDLNNPDAALIKALGIDETAFKQAQSEGRLATFIQEQFAVFEEANKLASNSISGISSNIQDVFEQVTRAAGASLTEGLVTALKSVETVINNNKESILAFGDTFGIALSEAFRFLENLFKVLSDAFGPTLLQLGKSIQTTFEIIGGGFKAVNDTVESGALDEELSNVANILRAIIDPIGSLIRSFRVLSGTSFEEANEDFENINATLGILQGIIGGVVNSWKEFSALTTDVDEQAGEAILINTEKLSVEILQATQLQQGYNRALEEGDLSKQEGYLDLLGDQLVQLKENRAIAASVTTFPPEQEQQVEAQIAAYDAQIAKLEELGATDPDPFAGSTFDTKPLAEYGSAIDQLEDKLTGVLRTIDQGAGGDTQLFERSIEEAQQFIQTLTELGQISTEDAVAELQKLASNASTTAEQRIAIEEQVTSTIKNQSEERIAQLDAEAAAIDAQLEANLISSSEAANQKLENERQRTLEQLSNAQQELAALEAGLGNERQIELVSQQIDKLTASLAGLDAQVVNERFEKAARDRQKAFEEEARAIELAFLTGQISSGQATVQNLESEIDKATGDLADIQQRISDARASGASESALNSLQDEANILINLLEQLEIKASDARIADTIAQAEREFTRANQAAQRASTQQQILLQQRINNEELAAEEISQIQASASREQTEIALEEAQRRVDLLNSLPIPQNQDEAFQREQELNGAIQQRFDLELQLLRDVQEETRAANQIESRAIEDQIELLQRKGDLSDQLLAFERESAEINLERLQTEIDLQEAINSLELAKINLQKQSSELRIRELNSAEQLNEALIDNENVGDRERQLIRERLQALGLLGATQEDIARERVKEVERQQQLELQALDLQQQGEIASLNFRQRQIQLQAELAAAEQRQAEQRAKQLAQEIELERVKAQLIEDPAQRARVLANLDQQAQLQQEAIQLAGEQVDRSEEYLNSLQQQFQIERELLQQQQAGASQQLASTQAEELFSAERQLARIQDAPQLESRQQSQRASEAGSSIRGNNSSNREFQFSTPVSNSSSNITNNITNNLNAPLTNPSIARSLGL